MRAFVFDSIGPLELSRCARCFGSRAVWVGNGVFWYALMGVILACHGAAAIQVVLHRVAVGLICTLLYKRLKAATSRPGPYLVNQPLPAMPGH